MASLSEVAIRVRDLEKRYAGRTGEVLAVQNASFDVADGEFVSLIGPSGCGKSTILNIVSGLLGFDSGEVIVAGTPASPGRRDVGLMPQRPTLFDWLSVLKNVLLPLEVFKIKDAAAVRRAHELLKLTGLEEFAHRYPWELSGGMQQRANLARALVFEPRILLMDEPFGALDEFTKERLTIELAGLHERSRRSTLYVTHNIAEAVFLSDKVVVMKSRPARIAEIVEIDLPRPRVRATYDDARLLSTVTHIRQVLFGQEAGV
jgi:NitT/TauT family transport system ATP-binding protein